MKRIPILLALALFVALACAGDLSARNTPWGYVAPHNYSGDTGDDHTWGGEVNNGDDEFTSPSPTRTSTYSFRLLPFDLILRWLESFHYNPFASPTSIAIRKRQIDTQTPNPEVISNRQGN